MNLRSLIILFIGFSMVSCGQYSPHSKWQSYATSDDELSNQQKIDLFEQNSNIISTSGLAAIAGLYEKQRAWELAMNTIQKAIEEDPLNSSYHSRKAKYAYELGRTSMAYQEALTAYQLGSKSLKQSLNLAKMAVALSEFRIVNDMIDSLLIAYPKDVNVLYMAARKYDKSNEVNRANKYYAKVFQLDPENLDNTLSYSRFLIRQNDFEKAKNVLSRIKPEFQSKTINSLRGDAFKGLNQYDSAAYFYQIALDQSPDTTNYTKILTVYTLTENRDGLMSSGKSAVLDYPENKEYLHIAAQALDNRGKFEEALPYYLTLYELDTLDTLVQAELTYLQRKIAYLQRKRSEEKQLADSLNRGVSGEN